MPFCKCRRSAHAASYVQRQLRHVPHVTPTYQNAKNPAGLALKSLVAHLAGRKGMPAPLQTTVCLLGCAFGIDAFRRPIAEAARACMRLHFVALVPEVDAGEIRLRRHRLVIEPVHAKELTSMQAWPELRHRTMRRAACSGACLPCKLGLLTCVRCARGLRCRTSDLPLHGVNLQAGRP